MPNLPTVSPDTERHLLGALIRDGLSFPPDLIPSDFGEPKHQEVASALISLAEQSVVPDELTVSARLRDMKATAAEHDVNAFTAAVGFTAYNPAWAAEVRRLSVLRSIRATASRVAEIASDPAADPSAILAFNEGQLKAVSGRSSEEKPSTAVEMPLDDLLAFDRKNDPDCVIGNRWLNRGGSCLLVSSSGVGKSSWTIQLVITLAIKRQGGFFGIEAKRPLRIVLIQGENNFGDVAEPVIDVCEGLGLHKPEIDTLRENLRIYRLKRKTGAEFLEEMRRLVKLHAADIVVVDPVMAFAGIPVADQQAATAFFRDGIDPILDETGAILLAVHHTTKPKSAKDTAGQTVSDLAYAGAGASDITNYVREVAVLQRCQGEEPIFKFSVTKRRGRSGMKDEMGDYASDIYVRHCRIPGVIRWERSSQAEVDGQKPDSSPAKGSPRRFDSK